jgi:hypothetical protein
MLGTASVLNAQDIHFTDVQGMLQWYNASLKQHKHNDLLLNLRDVRYHSNLAFQTGTALVNVSTEKKQDRSSSELRNYGNVMLGAAFDKSNNGLFRNNIGLLGYSYAMNLNSRGLYMAAGFQGLLTSYRLGGNGVYQDQLDQFGPIRGGMTLDPLRIGKRFTYFSLNAGWSMFQRSEKLDWYAGLSMRHVNRPFTEETKSLQWKLPVTSGLQGGVSLKNEFSQVDFFGMINLKAKAHEWIGGLRYNFLLGDNTQDDTELTNQNIVLGFGCIYRVNDAIIPEIQLKVGKTGIGLHYDMNMSGIRASGFTRRGFELQLLQKF